MKSNSTGIDTDHAPQAHNLRDLFGLVLTSPIDAAHHPSKLSF